MTAGVHLVCNHNLNNCYYRLRRNVDIVEVAGSSPVVPTKILKHTACLSYISKVYNYYNLRLRGAKLCPLRCIRCAIAHYLFLSIYLVGEFVLLSELARRNLTLTQLNKLTKTGGKHRWSSFS